MVKCLSVGLCRHWATWQESQLQNAAATACEPRWARVASLLQWGCAPANSVCLAKLPEARMTAKALQKLWVQGLAEGKEIYALCEACVLSCRGRQRDWVCAGSIKLGMLLCLLARRSTVVSALQQLGVSLGPLRPQS